MPSSFPRGSFRALTLFGAATFAWMASGASQAQELRASPFVFPALETHETTFHLVAVGDVLIHEPLHRQGLRDPQGFASLWAPVTPWIESADLAYANLEGPIAPGLRAGGQPDTDPGKVFDGKVYTSYPAFNYHAELAQALVNSGFDVVSTANNHALDRGARGQDATLAALDAVGLAHVGSRRSDQTGLPPAVRVTRSGWTVAWVACAFGTNGIPDRAAQVANCYTDRAALLAQVRAETNDPTVDAVIVTPHVGIEYEDRPRAEVIQLDRDFIEAGALAVLGAHPHVTQPWTVHTAADGHTGLIVYSLGNFVSGQFQRVPTRASVLVSLTLAKSPQGKAHLREVGYLPLEMKRQEGRYAVNPIDAKSGTPAIWQRLTGMFDRDGADAKVPRH